MKIRYFERNYQKNLLDNLGNMGYDLGLFQKLYLLIYASRIHDIIIIPVSSDPFNMKAVEKKEKIHKNKYLDKEMSFLDNIKGPIMIFEMPSEKRKCVSVFNKKRYAKTIYLTHT